MGSDRGYAETFNRPGWKMRASLVATSLFLAAACSDGAPEEANGGNDAVVLRNLVETGVAAPATSDYRLEGRLVPTPSDRQARYFLLRQRRAIGGNVIAIFRQERGERIAYARTEIDCARGRFHVLGVGSSRSDVEVDRTTDGPLRSIAGLPLREELARYVRDLGGTPLGRSS